jgi:hypothetical protein
VKLFETQKMKKEKKKKKKKGVCYKIKEIERETKKCENEMISELS